MPVQTELAHGQHGNIHAGRGGRRHCTKVAAAGSMGHNGERRPVLDRIVELSQNHIKNTTGQTPGKDEALALLDTQQLLATAAGRGLYGHLTTKLRELKVTTAVVQHGLLCTPAWTRWQIPT